MVTAATSHPRCYGSGSVDLDLRHVSQAAARLVGRENVIASTDCGFAQVTYFARVHPQIMWAKLEALVEGARIASKELWPRTAKRPSRKSAARRKGAAKRKVKRRAAA